MEDSTFEGWTTPVPGGVMDLPDGYVLPRAPHRPGYLGDVRVLPKATPDSSRFAERTWPQRDADDFEQCGKVWMAGGRYVSEPVSNFKEDGEHDACPNCGTRVESAISAPGEPVREATTRRCPTCGKLLRREVGGEWVIDETTP